MSEQLFSRRSNAEGIEPENDVTPAEIESSLEIADRNYFINLYRAIISIDSFDLDFKIRHKMLRDIEDESPTDLRRFLAYFRSEHQVPLIEKYEALEYKGEIRDIDMILDLKNDGSVLFRKENGDVGKYHFNSHGNYFSKHEFINHTLSLAKQLDNKSIVEITKEGILQTNIFDGEKWKVEDSLGAGDAVWLQSFSDGIEKRVVVGEMEGMTEYHIRVGGKIKKWREFSHDELKGLGGYRNIQIIPEKILASCANKIIIQDERIRTNKIILEHDSEVVSFQFMSDWKLYSLTVDGKIYEWVSLGNRWISKPIINVGMFDNANKLRVTSNGRMFILKDNLIDVFEKSPYGIWNEEDVIAVIEDNEADYIRDFEVMHNGKILTITGKGELRMFDGKVENE